MFLFLYIVLPFVSFGLQAVTRNIGLVALWCVIRPDEPPSRADEKRVTGLPLLVGGPARGDLMNGPRPTQTRAAAARRPPPGGGDRRFYRMRRWSLLPLLCTTVLLTLNTR